MTTESRAIAMLIDGDNAQPALIEHVLAEVAKYGDVRIRRVYGDWTTPQMGSWKNSLNSHAIQPIQQFRYTTGKNATDSALIIDAMDILHAGTTQGFCIVSSDSDFTRLATRIREDGLFVMGMGKRNTPEAFVRACDTFVFTEDIAPQAEEVVVGGEVAEGDWSALATRAIEMTARDDGWARMSAVGQALRRLQPDFSTKLHGFKQLTQLIKSAPERFEVRGQGTQTEVRLRN